MANKAKNIASNLELELNEANEKIKRLETALQEIENKFNDAESIANFGFFELDTETFSRTWTAGLFKIVGCDPEYGQLQDYYDNKKIMHPDDWDYFYNVTQTIIGTGKGAEIDVRAIKPDGSIIFIHIVAKPKLDENKKVIGINGTAQDITYLKKIENDLKKSETFYKTLFENTGTASIIIDEDATIIMANTQFEKLSGYSKEELENKMSSKEMVFKEDLERLEKYHYMRINNVGNPPESYEAKLIDKNGNMRFALINAAIIPGTKYIIASITDLNELKIAEETLQTTLIRFYTILRNMRASVLLVTKENVIEFANPAFCEYFGLNESPKDLRGLTASEIINKIKNAYQYPEEEVSHIHEIVSQRQPVMGEEIPMFGERTCLRDFIPIFVGEKLYGRLWLHLDITERKKMEKELADSERRYRHMVEKAAAGMFILDENGIIKYLNEHMAQALDYKKNEMLNKHIKSFVDENEDFYRYRKPVEIQIERYNWFKFLNKEKNVFWSNLTISPTFNYKKEYTGLLGIVTDINMQKGLEEAFLEREEILTDIIYDMMEMLNSTAKDKDYELNKNEVSNHEDLSNN
ncbi:PAS domain-containing protein [Methanobacterium oryzae]|uniref:PAS domain-containing protein n=1 Tax=Methanobacterium oryzae TaxID=69540 RepID=UPI003D1E6F44